MTQTPMMDPFISFDSYLAQMPFDFNVGSGLQDTQLPDPQNDLLANVNLDLDQDWGWYMQ